MGSKKLAKRSKVKPFIKVSSSSWCIGGEVWIVDSRYSSDWGSGRSISQGGFESRKEERRTMKWREIAPSTNSIKRFAFHNYFLLLKISRRNKSKLGGNASQASKRQMPFQRRANSSKSHHSLQIAIQLQVSRSQFQSMCWMRESENQRRQRIGQLWRVRGVLLVLQGFSSLPKSKSWTCSRYFGAIRIDQISCYKKDCSSSEKLGDELGEHTFNSR